MRDLLEKALVHDMQHGDTTVLAEVLTFVPAENVFGALGDADQINLMLSFLDTYGIRSSKDEDPAMTDLMCDNHYHFTVCDEGFYVNKDASCDLDEQVIYDHLTRYHKG